MVKRVVGCWLFRCCKNPLTWSRSETVKESSTYRFQILGLQVDLLSPVPQILVDSGIEIPEAWIPKITQHNSWSMRTYEETPSSNRNNNENRNAPIAANQRATNSDTWTIDLIAWWRLAVLQSKRCDQRPKWLHRILTLPRYHCKQFTALNNFFSGLRRLLEWVTQEEKDSSVQQFCKEPAPPCYNMVKETIG